MDEESSDSVSLRSSKVRTHKGKFLYPCNFLLLTVYRSSGYSGEGSC